MSASLGEPKYSVEECIERDMTYAAPLKATLRLIVWEREEEDEEEASKKKKKKKPSIPIEERRPQDIIEKEVYLGDLPLLTELGTFIINGAQRVVVSQLHRSPGVVFEESIHPNGTKLYSARIIPFRGSWVEFTLDINDVCYVHIDKKKKFPATALLRALGYSSDADIFRLYYDVAEVKLGKLDEAKKAEIEGKVIAEEFVDPETGEILIENGEEIEDEVIEILERLGVKKIKIYKSDRQTVPRREPAHQEHASRRTRPRTRRRRSAPSTRSCVRVRRRTSRRPARRSSASSSARSATTSGAWAGTRSTSGSGSRSRASETVLTQGGLRLDHRHLIELNEGRGFTDDIDHLGNRRVRTVGELIANQFSVGLSRMARLVKERMSINTDPEKINIDDLVNARTVSAVIQAFFGSSQLSQFMDQTNPLAEMTQQAAPVGARAGRSDA